jgi:hypothetical protein
MSERELAERRTELENRRTQLRGRYEDLNGELRASNDEDQCRRIHVEMSDLQKTLSGLEEEIRGLDAQLKAFRSSTSTYAKKHESVILAGCLTLERHLDELMITLLEGKPPESAGIAGKPLPLPPTEAEYAKRLLDELHSEVEAIRRRFSHGLADERPSLSLTYMWASVLLGKMEAITEALRPSGLERRYGEMPSDYKIFLQERLPSIERRIVELRRRYTTAENSESSLQR